MKLAEILKNPDHNKVISELKSKRNITEPSTGQYKDQLDPHKHEIFNRVTRPDKKVKIDPEDDAIEERDVVVSSESGVRHRWEKVARIAFALQKLIVKRAVSFIFGNAVTLDADPQNDQEKAVLKALKRILYDIKEKSFNRRIARLLFSCTEVAELWYPVEKKNNTYGFDSNYKLRCSILSPLSGDTLYPYFDDSGDMAAFSREFSVIDETGTSKNFFETYTDVLWMMWKQGADGYEPVEGFPKANEIGKIPVVFGNQEQVEWADVQVLIDRLEKLLSNFADTNDYHASPKIFTTGEIKGFSKKGEAGAIIEGEDGAKAEYLSWQNAPEAVKLEIETLLKMIYTISQTPDISFDAVKGIGSISGVALKLLFMDAHLKVAEHQEVFDEYLQRRINIIKAYVGKFNVSLKGAAENLLVEPVITPYMIVDEAAENKIWQDANGGMPVMSVKSSFQKAGMTKDPEADYRQYQDEQSARSSFSLFEPTQA